LPIITEDTVRRLAQFRGERAPVTSCYLDVDGKRLPRRADIEHELDVLLRRVRAKANGTPSVHADFHRIEAYVKAGFERSGVRGLAMFSCSDEALWEVVPLPVPVRNQVVVNHQPAVAQLESVVHEYDTFGVLLVDRQRTRLFRFELGELVDQSEVVDELPRDYDDRGERERGDVAPHVDELATQHARRAARAAWGAHQRRAFDHLAIGGPDDVVVQVEAALHPYLRDRCCERIPIAVGASVAEIRDAALDLERAVGRAREATLVDRLRTARGEGNKAVTGLADTLAALGERRIDHLLVSDGFSQVGWRCDPCGWLAARGPKCPVCGDPMERIDDVVEEAVEVALTQSCAVAVCTANADLDVAGRIGALLRY
jgi:peptide chain release factor subunit 1